ncbi:HEAT repeat domain-containing protein [Roseofilum sp. BLCC_M91]|uniref:HEAT repeat domain-containing protein n=1 Tax=Roseofilum halophilum BLCC-M91 TaxID=3022259 RepID=A0ABT7BL10_9CYAN|nr:HEAT repeat domain-containing protein [Roseofilum halophilum]MDJ1179880.1 HEAT repeat domain-containing protein [Roseofilum halophilum BLCC-M91]
MINAPSESPEAPQLTVDRAIANLLQGDRGERYYAAWWLGRFRVKEPEAIEALVGALEDESDRTPEGGYALRRNAARALGKLAEPRVIPPLIECLHCADFYVRETAAQALGELGADLDRPHFEAAIPELLSLLAGGLEAAQPIPGCPHLAQPYNAVIETLGILGVQEAIPQIEPFLNHPLEIEQYGAARALYQLTGDRKYGDRLKAALEGDKLQLRRAVLSDLGAIGYLPAAEAIAETLAENSLKLISLKGLLEHHLQTTDALNPPSETAISLMTLMDSLL